MMKKFFSEQMTKAGENARAHFDSLNAETRSTRELSKSVLKKLGLFWSCFMMSAYFVAQLVDGSFWFYLGSVIVGYLILQFEPVAFLKGWKHEYNVLIHRSASKFDNRTNTNH